MKKCLLLAFVVLLGTACGGGGYTVTVAFTTPATTTNVATNTTIVATITDSGIGISVPTDWGTVFTVIPNIPGGTNVCSNDNVVYSAANKTITCTPAANLLTNTQYVATMSGLHFSNGPTIATATLTFTTTSSTAVKKIFATDSTHNGNFGASPAAAIAAADAFCEDDANKPDDGLEYKAMLVNSARVACTTDNCSGGVSEHTDWVLSPSITYYQSDGTTEIGTTTANGIFEFPLTNAFSGDIVQKTPWTGLYSDWTVASTSLDNDSDCTDWSLGTQSEEVSGVFGYAFFTEDNSIYANSGYCSQLYQIYCVAQ